MIPNRRDFLAIAKRLSILPIFLKTFPIVGQTKPPVIPSPPPVIGPGNDDSTWDLTRQAQQRMSDYIQQVLQSANNNTQGASISINHQTAPKYQYVPGPVSYGEDEHGALHEDFPQAPNRFNPETGTFFTDEGQRFNPPIDFEIDLDVF